MTLNQIQIDKKALLNEYSRIQQNAQAFDEFQEFYKDKSEEFDTLFHRKFTNIEPYINKKNRCTYSPQVLETIKERMEAILERNKKLSILEEKLKKRNMDLDNYLAIRRRKNGITLTRQNAQINEIDIMLESIELMDEIDCYLQPLGMRIEEYLKIHNKTLEEIKNKELKTIFETLKENQLFKSNLDKVENEESLQDLEETHTRK